jgi:ankyrin repeat protein
LAAEEGYVDIAVKLLESDADPSIKNKEEKTPLDLAPKEMKATFARRMEG